jgi:hypothetical protein
MAYKVPDFPLKCNIYTGPPASLVLRIQEQMCNLAVGKRVHIWGGGILDYTQGAVLELLLPALTDVRAPVQVGNAADVIEVPAGSGRWYAVLTVDDYGKGFPNEHRYAVINQVSKFAGSGEFPNLLWPVPMP